MGRLVITDGMLSLDELSAILAGRETKHKVVKYTGSGGYVKALLKLRADQVPTAKLLYNFHDDAAGTSTFDTVHGALQFLDDMESGIYDKQLTKPALRALGRA